LVKETAITGNVALVSTTVLIMAVWLLKMTTSSRNPGVLAGTCLSRIVAKDEQAVLTGMATSGANSPNNLATNTSTETAALIAIPPRRRRKRRRALEVVILTVQAGLTRMNLAVRGEV
jgi:hypothetical protein